MENPVSTPHFWWLVRLNAKSMTVLLFSVLIYKTDNKLKSYILALALSDLKISLRCEWSKKSMYLAEAKVVCDFHLASGVLEFNLLENEAS